MTETQIIKPNSREDFLEALKKNNGNISLTCKTTGWSRQTIYDWKRSDSSFSEELEKIIYVSKEKIADLAENALKKRIIKGDTTAIIFTLKSLRRAYYGERIEVENSQRKVDNPATYPKNSTEAKMATTLIMLGLRNNIGRIPLILEESPEDFERIKEAVERISEIQKNVNINEDDKSQIKENG